MAFITAEMRKQHARATRTAEDKAKAALDAFFGNEHLKHVVSEVRDAVVGAFEENGKVNIIELSPAQLVYEFILGNARTTHKALLSRKAECEERLLTVLKGSEPYTSSVSLRRVEGPGYVYCDMTVKFKPSLT